MKKFAIAGNSNQFYDWMRKTNRSHTDWIYVSGPDTLKGISDPHGVFIGTWYERPDMLEVIQTLRHCTRVRNEKLNIIMDLYMQHRLGFDT